jgi:hypothetical protein
MRTNDDDQPLPEIADLAPGVAPPATLEGAVVRRLRTEGLLARPSLPAGWALAATVLVALAVGWGAGRYLGFPSERLEPSTRPAVAAAAEPRFVLFLWEGESYRPADAAHLADRVARYGRWAADLRARGRTASGEKLADEVRLLRPGESSTQASASEATGRSPLGELGGYFLIEAASLEEAEQVAATCPHLAFGGAIEVRRIEG